MAKAVHSEEDAYICMDIDSGLLEETAVLGDRYVSPVVANKAIPLFALHRTGGSRDYTGAFV